MIVAEFVQGSLLPLWIFLWVICAAIGAAIGKDRKMGQGGGFALGLLLGLIGVLIVAVSAKPSTLDKVQTAPAAPGWYGDPLGRFDGRYYDGAKWTQHVGRLGQDGTRMQFEDPI